MNQFMSNNMGDMVTTPQLIAISKAANFQRVDQEAICLRLYCCKPEELSRRAASNFIDFLKSDECQMVQLQIDNLQAVKELLHHQVL